MVARSNGVVGDVERQALRRPRAHVSRRVWPFATRSSMRRDVAGPIAWQDEAVLRGGGDVEGCLGAQVGNALGTDKTTACNRSLLISGWSCVKRRCTLCGSVAITCGG